MLITIQIFPHSLSNYRGKNWLNTIVLFTMTNVPKEILIHELKMMQDKEKDERRNLVPTVRIKKVFFKTRTDGLIPDWICRRMTDHGSFEIINFKESDKDQIGAIPRRVYRSISVNEVKVKDFSCQFPPVDTMLDGPL